ncbi:hypothetical protein O181_075058 [Austropuccinia psidii MF-1]|uniref:Integrase catalytic domain-containing protein n=1 Tax=Austropuccinia psidii MF-1 TaxID=1389203 RepID=A0A9Q3IBI2_9BASI|nr:hypothetical protein [Austropuccinia psidii MF-1]
MVNQPGDLIVAELMGPYEVSLNHKNYIIMIQDAFSRVVVAIMLTDKTEAKTYFINWIKQFMNVTMYKIDTIWTDNGTEFKNNILNDFIISNGIIHEYSMPYKHHQNGCIERINQTISEMARTSIIAAKLPSFLWPWAFYHSVWIFNHSLHFTIDKTPFELLGKKNPDQQVLRVFGAKSFLYLHTFKKDFSPRAIVAYHGEDEAILWIHVDYGALTALLTALLDWISQQLNAFLKIKWDKHTNGLVGISIKETNEGFKFSQPDLINKLVNLTPSNIVAKTPLPANYQSHWDALELLIAYMRGTKDMGILISKSNKSSEMKCFFDANWGGEGNRSTHGYIIMHGVNPVGWQSKKQTTIASSTAQSEYMAL